MRRVILIVLLLVSGICLQAQQTIKGKVLDSMMKPLNSATVQLNKNAGNVTVQETLTDSLGNFAFENIDSGRYIITASFIGYTTVSKPLHVAHDTITTDSVHIVNITAFVLNKTSGELSGVTVTASAPAVVQKADTTQFSASQYKVNPDATTEDLVKKMPGITVASDGTVTAQGETVKKVLVDGKEFFGDDASAALKNLPADIIDKIQVFDKLSDQAQFTGFDDGNTSKTINVVTKGGIRNSQFGKLYAGYGTDKRYLAGGNLNYFDGDKRISIIGLANNVNQQNFSQQDILGALNTGSNSGNRGGGGQRGGQGGGGQGGRSGNSGGGGAPGGFGGGAGNFLTGTQQGINSTNSFGINYSDTWAKNLNVTGSYFFNNTKNTTGELTNRQTFITADSSIFYKEDENSTNNNYNHRINLRMEYKIDSFNQIIFTPVVGFQNNTAISSTHGVNSLEDGNTLSDVINNTSTHSSGYNFNATLLYRHAFAKRGRSISLGITPGMTDNTGKTYQDAFSSDTVNAAIDSTLLLRDRNSHTKSIAASFSYTEPIGKKAMLQFNYNPSWQNSTSKQYTYDYNNTASKYNLLDTSLSNLFDNDITKHSAGLNYRIGDRFNNFSVGLNYQYTKMNSDQTYPKELMINKSFTNVLPNLMFSLKLSAKSNIRVMYRAATQAPSVTQLQNVFNNNNPLQVTTGNPDLKQAYNNTLSARYIYTNTSKSQSFFFNAFVQQNNNYITNATYTASKDSLLTPSVILATGSQLSKPVNVNGYWSYRSFATYSLPIKFTKSNLSINGGFNYTKQPGLINNLANTSKNFGYNGGLSIGSNISEYVDFTVNYTAGYNVVKNTLQPTLNSNYYSGAASANLNLLSKNGWEFITNVTNQMYSGLTAGYNQSYTLWNASVGKKFLKNQRGDIRLSVFDILKQNQSISRNVTESYVEDVQTNVLRRYFMLTFTFKLNNIRTAKATTQKNNRRNEMRPDGPPPDGPPPGAPPGGADGGPPPGDGPPHE